MKSAYAPHSDTPLVALDFSGPIKMLEAEAKMAQTELTNALGEPTMISVTGGLLARMNSYRRAEAILRGLFTVDGEELVDTDSADLPKILREEDT